MTTEGDSKVPDEFLVKWDDPTDAERTWTFDPMHNPDVMPPLAHELNNEPLIRGFSKGRAESGNPTEMRSAHINYYSFMSRTVPPRLPDSTPPSPETMLQRSAPGGRRWREEILPEVRRLIDYYRNTDFEALSDAGLVGELLKLREMRVEQGRLHMLATTPWQTAMNLLIDTYQEITGGEELAALRLTQGYGNKSVEAGKAIWELGKIASAEPVVQARLKQMGDEPAEIVLADLAQEASAGEFLQKLSVFLDEFGWRTSLLGWGTATWAEDPTILLNQLRAYLELDGYDPDVELRRLGEERDAAEAEIRDSLSADDWVRLEAVMNVARDLAPILEDHNYYIDQQLSTLPRRLVLAAGRRLVSNSVVDEASDVFYLHLSEFRDALENPGDSLVDVVSQRKQEMEQWSKVTPPPFVGAPPPPPSAGNSFANNLQRRFMGNHSLQADQPDLLPGNAGSAGVAQGVARVMLDLKESNRLRKGDILVARTTMPPWTPLFAIASAIVVETGGILSHAAVTAREYGIPAVLGVNGATRHIRDGQLLEVDGNKGTVRLLT